MESNISVHDPVKIEDIAASARWTDIVEAQGRDFMDLFFVTSTAQSAQRAFYNDLPFYPGAGASNQT
jgi:hypothetical protein